jgi:hypothetical protein
MDSRDFNLVGIGLDDLIEVRKTRLLSAILVSLLQIGLKMRSRDYVVQKKV